MFERRTVFVIGAGASKEFGMPTGDDLRRDMAEILGAEAARKNGDPFTNFRATLMNTVGPDWQNLLARGHEIARALPTFVSIDETLHYFSSDKDLVRLGKLAVAYILLRYERKSKISLDERGHARLSAYADTWLAEFLSMALSFSKRESVKEAFHNICFINFNYDRVIEQYIRLALPHLVSVSQADADAITLGLNMIRPYGDLGPLDMPNRRGVSFGFDPYNNVGLAAIAENVRTYTEQLADNIIPQMIERVMAKAELVIFLGFGFHQQNVALLRTDDRSLNKPVFATAFKIDKDNYDLFSQNLTEFFGENIRLFDKTGAALLKDLRPTIAAAASAPRKSIS